MSTREELTYGITSQRTNAQQLCEITCAPIWR